MTPGSKRSRLLAIAMLVLAASMAIAGGRKVLVLPLEGNADPAMRAKLGTVVVKIARSGGGNVSTGDTTFTDTAAAVGCEPSAQGCADTVLATLGVDEIVYGTATTSSGQTIVVVTRVTKGKAQIQSTQLEANDSPDKAESGLRPLYPTSASATPSGSNAAGSSGGPNGGSTGSASEVGDGQGAGSGTATGETSGTSSRESFFDTRERKLGCGFIAGGGLALVIGLALWSSESSIQSQVDSAPNKTAAEIANLRNLEDRANRYAWEGNIMVLLGLAAGGVGAYYLWIDHKARVSATVAPVDHGTGGMAFVGGHW